MCLLVSCSTLIKYINLCVSTAQIIRVWCVPVGRRNWSN